MKLTAFLKRWFWGVGRARRQTYWIGILSLAVVSLSLHPAGIRIATAFPLLLSRIGIIELLVSVIGAWLWLSVSTRRLHDLGRSGWWQFMVLLVALAFFLIARPGRLPLPHPEPDLAEILGATGVLLYIGFTIALGFLRGAPQPNRFGPPPMA